MAENPAPALVTIECSRGQDAYTLFSHGAVLDVHLAAPRDGGTGPCLCGYDRFTGGFAVGGGVTGPGAKHHVCAECARLAADAPVRGLHAGLFALETTDA